MQKNMIIFLYYLLFNLFLFALMGYDKNRARKDQRRVPEATLLSLGLLGAPLGGLLGMRLFRHKTRKTYFWLVYLFALLLHVFLLWRFGPSVWN